MIKVGLTGNIGSGKTMVTDLFKKMSVPIYNSDIEAKKFLYYPEIKIKLIDRFSEKIIDNNEVDTKVLSNIVFDNSEELNFLNSLIHPLVAEDFEKWCIFHKNKNYIIIETAILFESGFDKLVDFSIVVTAPLEIRLQRILNRDNCEVDQIQKRMKNQWDELIKVKLADFEITNDGQKALTPQISKIHKILQNNSKKGK